MKKLFHAWGLLICLFSPLFVLAQNSCTRYTIYKEDFGGGVGSPNIGDPLPRGATTYTYTGDIPVQDGFYGIRKQVKGHGPSKGNAWHQLTDHTGDGYMMLVNADYDPGLFYQKKITDLCEGTSFRFSAWVANLMRSSAAGRKDPNLKFVILNPETKEVIADTVTGLLRRYNQPKWEEYSLDFDLPAGVSSVILQIFNNAEGGDGNDLVLDDITFSICGPPMDTTVSGMYHDGANICTGQEVRLHGKLSDGSYQNPQYQWQFGKDTTRWEDLPGARSTDFTITETQPTDSGWYRIVAAEAGNLQRKNCRIASDPIPVHVWQARMPEIVTNSPVCEGESLFLKIPEDVKLETRWSGPNGFTSDESKITFSSAEPALSGVYQVNVVNPGGCDTSGSRPIEVQVNDLAVSFPSTDSIICEGTVQILDATNPGATYLWNTGATTPKIQTDTGGFYKVTVQKQNCSLSDSLRLYYLKSPKVALGNDTTVCEGEPFFLHATYTNVEDYQWENGSADSVFVVTHPGTYTVTLKNDCGTAKDAIRIQMESCSEELIFPTAFTPNNDGQNDTFRPRVLFELTDYRLRIFDRWGQQVFQSADPSESWNGDIQGHRAPSGTYIWIVKYKRSKNNHKKSQKGVITLIR